MIFLFVVVFFRLFVLSQTLNKPNHQLPLTDTIGQQHGIGMRTLIQSHTTFLFFSSLSFIYFSCLFNIF